MNFIPSLRDFAKQNRGNPNIIKGQINEPH